MSTSTGTNGATGVAETNGQAAPQDTTGEGVDLGKGIQDPANNTTAGGAAAQEAEPKEQKSKFDEILSSGRFLPTEAEERPEPFATIADLIGEYGVEEVLQAISDHALFDSENPEACSCCRPTHGDSADERLPLSKEKARMQA
jgi:hypothetical protein